MTNYPYQEVLAVLANSPDAYVVEPILPNAMNPSFKITNRLSGESLLLQQINTAIFPEPQLLQHNYDLVWKYARENVPNLRLATPFFFPDGNLLFADSNNRCWRIFEYLEHVRVLPNAATTTQARLAAEAFGDFTFQLRNFDSSRLHALLPRFHDLTAQYEQFEQLLHSRNLERLAHAAETIQQLRQRRVYTSFYEVLTQSGELPRRTIHHDAGLHNLLYAEDGEETVAITDLDTVMPGYFFSDLGELIRTMCAANTATDAGPELIALRPDIYEAIVNGYLLGMQGGLTPIEMKYLHSAGLLMTYLHALRLMADYFNPDPQHADRVTEQNLNLANGQLQLLSGLEEYVAATHNLVIVPVA